MTPSYSLIIFIHLILKEYYVGGTSVSPLYRWRHRMVKKLVQVTHLVSGTLDVSPRVYHHAMLPQKLCMYLVGFIKISLHLLSPTDNPCCQEMRFFLVPFSEVEICESWSGWDLESIPTWLWYKNLPHFKTFPVTLQGDWFKNQKCERKPKDLRAACSYEKKQKVEVPTFTQSLLLV